MFDVSAGRDILASPARVWEALCDTHHYAEWVAGLVNLENRLSNAAP